MLLFGGHKLWDDYATIQIIRDVVSIASLAFSAITPLGVWVAKCATLNSVVKAFFFIANGITNDFVSSGLDLIIDEAGETTSLTWAYTFVMAYKNIVELAMKVNSKVNFYPQIFDYCINDLMYNVNIKFSNGQTSQLKEIRDALKL